MAQLILLLSTILSFLQLQGYKKLIKLSNLQKIPYLQPLESWLSCWYIIKMCEFGTGNLYWQIQVWDTKRYMKLSSP